MESSDAHGIPQASACQIVVVGRAAAMLLQERPVDQLDMDAAVLHGLDGVGDLYQLARGGSSHPLALHLKKFGEVSLIRGEFDPGCLEPFHAVGAIVSLALGFDLPHREDGIECPRSKPYSSRIDVERRLIRFRSRLRRSFG